jgi:hypothetical protein
MNGELAYNEDIHCIVFLGSEKLHTYKCGFIRKVYAGGEGFGVSADLLLSIPDFSSIPHPNRV